MRRFYVTALLSTLGATVGAIAAPLLSFLATAVAQASLPSGRVAYVFDPVEFAVVGAIGIPMLAWLLMPRVPLWRAITEPAIGGALGLLATLASIPLLNVPLVFLSILMLAGTVGAAVRLRHTYRSALSLGGAVSGKAPRQLGAS
jgi:hypothetical protein